MEEIHHVQKFSAAVVIYQHGDAKIPEAIDYTAVFGDGVQLLEIHQVAFIFQLELKTHGADLTCGAVAYKPGAAVFRQQFILCHSQLGQLLYEAQVGFPLFPVPVLDKQYRPAAPLQFCEVIPCFGYIQQISVLNVIRIYIPAEIGRVPPVVCKLQFFQKYLSQAEAQLSGAAKIQMGVVIEIPAVYAGLLRHFVEVIEIQPQLFCQPRHRVGIGLVFLQIYSGSLYQNELYAFLPAQGDYTHKVVQRLVAYLCKLSYLCRVGHIEIPMAVKGVAALVVYWFRRPGEVFKILLCKLSVTLVVQWQSQQQREPAVFRGSGLYSLQLVQAQVHPRNIFQLCGLVCIFPVIAEAAYLQHHSLGLLELQSLNQEMVAVPHGLHPAPQGKSGYTVLPPQSGGVHMDAHVAVAHEKYIHGARLLSIEALHGFHAVIALYQQYSVQRPHRGQCESKNKQQSKAAFKYLVHGLKPRIYEGAGGILPAVGPEDQNNNKHGPAQQGSGRHTLFEYAAAVKALLAQNRHEAQQSQGKEQYRPVQGAYSEGCEAAVKKSPGGKAPEHVPAVHQSLRQILRTEKYPGKAHKGKGDEALPQPEGGPGPVYPEPVIKSAAPGSGNMSGNLVKAVEAPPEHKAPGRPMPQPADQKHYEYDLQLKMQLIQITINYDYD